MNVSELSTYLFGIIYLTKYTTLFYFHLLYLFSNMPEANELKYIECGNKLKCLKNLRARILKSR